MRQQTLTITDDSASKKIVIHHVSFQIKGPGKFTLVDQQNKVLYTLRLTNTGSDGMSDIIYPFVAYRQSLQTDGGGCESNYLKKWCKYPNGCQSRRVHPS